MNLSSSLEKIIQFVMKNMRETKWRETRERRIKKNVLWWFYYRKKMLSLCFLWWYNRK